VPVSEIVEGIKNGVRKVNIDTDLRMASTGAIRKHLAEDRKNFDPRKFFKEATKAMKGICQDRYEAFGAGGMASKITKVYSLEGPCKSATTKVSWHLAWLDVLSIIGAQRRRDLSLVLT
jgi:hypothetical protein